RTVAEQTLLDLEQVLGAKPSPGSEEEEFVVSMQGTWKDARRIGRDEGRTEGRVEEAVRAVLTVLRARDIVVPDAARERILAREDRERLERWLEKAAVAASVNEVLGEPS